MTWWWFLVAALAIADWVVVATRPGSPAEKVLKPGVMLALIGVLWQAGAAGTDAGRWLLLALVLGLVGDVFLLGDSEARFLGGLGAFLVGHLAYVICFVVLGLNRPPWAMIGVVVIALALIATRQVLPRTYADGGMALAAPVALYMGVIAAMVISAWATGILAIGLGASIFAASDSLLAFDRFVAPFRWARPAVMCTYHVGQALIVAGALHAL